MDSLAAGVSILEADYCFEELRWLILTNPLQPNVGREDGCDVGEAATWHNLNLFRC